MTIKQEYQQANLSINSVRYFLLWLRVTLLKILSLGFYAPWANQMLNHYLLSNTRFSGQSFEHYPNANHVFKIRLLFLVAMSVALLLTQVLPMLSWFFQLLMLISLPGYYLLEKRYEFNTISLDNHNIHFQLSLFDFYKFIALPISFFVLFALVIFNYQMIDSRFLDSIDTKEGAAIYAEDSYLALAEQGLQKESRLDAGSDHDEHTSEIKQWNDNISAAEKAYLEEHEKSHNHGSIVLSPLQKYQVANQGNRFMQYALVFILLCLLWPWMDYKLMAYRVNHTQFLGSNWEMKLGIMSLYKLYIMIFILVLAMLAVIGLILSNFLMGSEGSSAEFWSNLLANALWLLPLAGMVFLFAVSLLFTWRKQWLLNSLVSQYVHTHSESLYLATLLLSATNTVAVFFTLGLALPWCHLRTTRYFIKHFTVAV